MKLGLQGCPGTTNGLGAGAVRAAGLDRPCSLTITQENDEVLGGCLCRLQLFGGTQGLGCLAVPEVWVLLFNWPGESKDQVSLGWGVPCV